MSEQLSPKHTCCQTSISTLQISWKDTDSGPSAVTCRQPRGQKSRLSLPPPQAQGTVCPREPARHRQAPPNTPSAHPTWGSGGMVPVGSDRQQTAPQSNGGTPGGEAAVPAEHCSQGCATPPAIQAAPQSWRGSASQGAGRGSSFCQGQRPLAPEEGEQRAQAPPTALPCCCSTSPSQRQPHGTNGDRQRYGHWGQILPDTDPASVGRRQLTQGRSRAESCRKTRHSVLNRHDASGCCVGFIAD